MTPERATRPIPGVVLIVEDSDEDFDTVKEAAGKIGLTAEIRRSTTGGEGVEILRELVDAGRPAVVLMDLNTPGIDGRDALGIIKAEVDLRATPVVILSTSNNPRDVHACYSSGASAYHVKPVRYQDHLRLMGDLLDYWLVSTVLPAGDGSRR